VWSKRGEKIGSYGGKATMLQVWEKRTQEVEVSKKE